MTLNGTSHKTCEMRGRLLVLPPPVPTRKAPSPPSRPLHQSTHSTAVSESSYLPFLFHSEDKLSPSFNGRRSFVKGKEVVPVCFTFPLTPQYAITRLIPAFIQRLRSNPSRHNHYTHNLLLPGSNPSPSREGLAPVTPIVTML